MDTELLTFLTNTGVPTLICLVLLKQNKEYVKAIRTLAVRVRKLEKLLKSYMEGEDYEEED